MFRIILILVWFNLSGASALSSQEECSDLRLDKEGGSLESIPIYDQGHTSLCYAYSASTSYDSFRIGQEKQDPAKLSSPMAAAFSARVWSAYLEMLDLDGGLAEDALEYMVKNGSCDNNQFLKSINGNQIKSVEKDMRQLYDLMNTPGNEHEGKITELYTKIEDPINFERKLDFKTYAIASKKSFYIQFLDFMLKERCSEPLRIEAHHRLVTFNARDIPMKYETRAQKLKELITKILVDKNSQAPELAFCMGMVRDASFPAGIDDETGERTEICRKYSHSAVLAGRRWNKELGSCQFLIRNAWRTNCDANFYKGLECENGQVWVNEESLIKNTLSLTYIE